MKTKKKKILFVFVCFIIILVSSCSLFLPDYVGTWIDSTTIPDITVILEFDRNEFTVIVDLPDPDPNTVASGTLDRNKNTLTVTLISLDYSGTLYTGPALETLLKNLLDLPGPVNSVTYSVSGNTMTISGELILKISGKSNTLTAVKS